MNLEKEFVPYQQSLELKELGFDEPCFTWYWDDIGMYNGLEFGNHNKKLNIVSAPTFSQAFRWFREVHSLYHNVETYFNERDEKIYIWNTFANFREKIDFQLKLLSDEFLQNENSYEEAELTCLKKLIELVK
jgi:hypothetical protein